MKNVRAEFENKKLRKTFSKEMSFIFACTKHIQCDIVLKIRINDKAKKVKLEIPSTVHEDILAAFFEYDQSVYTFKKRRDNLLSLTFPQFYEDRAKDVLKFLFWFISELKSLPETHLITVKCSGELSKNLLPYNRIEVNKKWAEDIGLLENEIVLFPIFNNSTFSEFRELNIKYNDAIQSGEFAISRNISTKELSNYCLIYLAKQVFKKHSSQVSEKIKAGYITISNEINLDMAYSFYQIIHPLSGSTIDIPIHHILKDKSIKAHEIKMNRLHNILLSLHTPTTLEGALYEAIVHSDKLSEVEKN